MKNFTTNIFLHLFCLSVLCLTSHAQTFDNSFEVSSGTLPALDTDLNSDGTLDSYLVADAGGTSVAPKLSPFYIWGGGQGGYLVNKQFNPQAGANFLMMKGNDNCLGLLFSCPIVSNKTYTISFWAAAWSPTGPVTLSPSMDIKSGNGSWWIIGTSQTQSVVDGVYSGATAGTQTGWANGTSNYFSIGAGWTPVSSTSTSVSSLQWKQYSFTFNTPAGGTPRFAISKFGGDDGYLCLDGITCAEVTACTPIVGLSNNPTASSISTGGSTTLNANASSGLSGTTTYSWSGTGGFSSTQQSPSTGTLNTAGGYSYTVTATNTNGTGTCTATASSSMTVSSSITCTNTVTTICNNQSVTISTDAGLVNVQWYKDGTAPANAIAGANNNEYTTNVAGTYYYKARDNAGCDVNSCCGIQLIVNVCAVPCTPITGLSASVGSNNIATGASTTLSTNATSGISGTTTFSWSGTGGFSSNQQNPSTGVLNTAGGYSYTVTVTNSSGTGTCTATASTSLTVSTTPIPCTGISNLSATASPNPIIEGGSSTLYPSGTGITGSTTFNWAGTGGFNSTQKEPVVYPSGVGSYSYTVTATNANGTGTCTATASTILTVTPAPVFDLALKKTLAAGQSQTVTIGSTVTFTISVINQGNVDATNVQITDYIPSGLVLSDVNWTTSAGKATLNTLISSIPAGQTITRNISFTVSATGSLVNTAEISSAMGGIDKDSTPDNDNANDGTIQDDVVSGNHKSNPNDDEDDHDIATVISNCGTPQCNQIGVIRIR